MCVLTRFRCLFNFFFKYRNSFSFAKEKAGGNTLEYASRRCHSDFEMYPLDDFESFLYSMAFVNGIELEWFKDAIYEKLNELASFKLAGEIKKNVTKIEVSLLLWNCKISFHMIIKFE